MYRIPWPTWACATSPARHWAEQMNRKTNAGNEGQSSFSCASNSSLEPVPALTTATCCSHAVPPFVLWLQVSGATCTWYTFKPRMAYRVWTGSLSKNADIYMKLTYICFTEWQGNPHHLLEDESSCSIAICTHNGNKSIRIEQSTSLDLFCGALNKEFSFSLAHTFAHWLVHMIVILLNVFHSIS